MTGFLRCAVYLAAISLLSFFLGRLLPKSWFLYDQAPYRSFSFERNGDLYDMLRIRAWKDRLPDMSRLLPTLIPVKTVPHIPNTAQLELMLQETCVAESVHMLLCVLGAGCILLWDGPGGWLLFGAYALGNIPFCLIQRYNRPRLAALLNRTQTRKVHQKHSHGTHPDIELQHGAGA